MAEVYTATIPKITAAVFSANPAAMNSKITLSVTVTEETVTLEPTYFYSGDIYAGEV